MSLIFMDGFDHYNTADLTKKWNSASSCSITRTGGRRGGGGFQFASAWSGYGAVKNFAAVQGVVVGAAFMMNNGAPSNNLGAYLFRDSAGTAQVSIRPNTDGSISVLRGTDTGGTELGRAPAGSLYYNYVWYYLEAKVFVSTTAGYVQLRVNNQLVLNLQNVNTQATSNANIASMTLQNSGCGAGVIADDFYLLSIAGTTNNDFLGDCRIDTVFPVGAGTYQEMPSSQPVLNYGAHSYWRVNFSKTQGASAFLQLEELYFRTTPGGAQVATGGTATSSGDNASYPVSRLFDGNTTTYWQSSNTADSSGNITAWVQYQFTAPQNIVEFAIVGSASSGSYDPTALNIQYSDDGVNFTTVTSFTTGTWGLSATQTFDIPQTTTDLVKKTTPDTVTYVVGTTPGQRETFKVGALPSGLNQIYAVQTTVAAMKDDTISRSIMPMVVSGTTIVTGTDTQLTTSQLYYSQQFDTNPGTNANWQQADITSIEVGAEVGNL